MARALQEDRGYQEEEIVVERPDGSRRTVLAHATPLHDDSGKIVGGVNILVDITERKQAEETLRDADRRKSQFLAMLSHELRNPLAPLRNGLQIVRLVKDDEAVVSQAHAMMDRQLGHLVRLIDDLLDLSRINSGKIELRRGRTDIALVVRDAVETSRPLIDARRHDLKVILPNAPVWVDADRTRLAQVFSNLLNNSAKYTDVGGHICLSVERQGSDVVVTVKDDGVGIAPDLVPRIFEMFTQADQPMERSAGGLGIGLSLVRALVELHGGRVEVYSDGPGHGAEFRVRLPVMIGAVADRVENGDVTSSHSRQRILVVDDNRDSAISLALVLKIMGHETQTAFDGQEAVEMAEEFRPSVLLLDIGLPRLDGYAVCRRIREQPWADGVVIIALSGWGQDEDKRRSKDAGFNFHMVKPVDTCDLEKLLGGLLLAPL
ncbi:hypothetical protein AYO40_00900 [Planctomycetaceae bacterium SCGC AG-212-D15]|nr:hypothetical protein AYO40_00900 [Planctomycetaceae bacterium SCGC AG-212-D15]